jgi:toxin ParE1/3/4
MKKCALGWKAGNGANVRVDWSPSAVGDLKAIAEWIEPDRDLETANRVARAIYDAIQSLRSMPYRGRYGRLENTRELVIARLPYVVVYQVFEERVVILNVCTVHSDGREHKSFLRASRSKIRYSRILSGTYPRYRALSRKMSLQNPIRMPPQAPIGAPGARNVEWTRGNSPFTAGNGRAKKAPCGVIPVAPSCAAV